MNQAQFGHRGPLVQLNFLGTHMIASNCKEDCIATPSGLSKQLTSAAGPGSFQTPEISPSSAFTLEEQLTVTAKRVYTGFWYYGLLQWENISRVVRKPAFCICENKDADQLRGNREADQRLCFRYTDSTIPLLPKSEISSL